MMRKVLIAGIILWSFIATMMNVAVAVNVTTLTDDIGDVILDEELVTNKKYLDIKELVCYRDYRQVTLKLTVDAAIENKGDILIWKILFDEEFAEEYTSGLTEAEIEELLIELASQDWVQYSFEIYTSGITPEYDNIYNVIYVNNEILILDGEANLLTAKDSSVSGGTLTVIFDLATSKENMTEIAAVSEEYSNYGETVYEDSEGIYGECNDPFESSVNNDNGNDDQDDSGSGLIVFIAIIVIMIIVGVAVVFYILRR
jgi:hypothetical protein